MIEIDGGSVNTGRQLFNKTLRASEFFDIEKYPKIRVHSLHLIFEGDNLKQINR